MLRIETAAGNRTNRQQLVRQVSPRDALVARGAFCFVESSAAVGEKPCLVYVDSPQRARTRKVTRIPGRALAKDGRTRRPRQSFAGWAVVNLAAAPSDLL